MSDTESTVRLKIKVDDSEARKLDDVGRRAAETGGGGGAPGAARGGGQKTFRPAPAPFMREGLQQIVSARGASDEFYQDPRRWISESPKLMRNLDRADQASLHRYANWHERQQSARVAFEQRDADRQARMNERRRTVETQEEEKRQRAAAGQGGGGFIRGAASTALGFGAGALAVGLGGSVESFFMNTATWAAEYMKQLELIEAQYGKVARQVMSIGHGYGYVAQQSMAAVSAYGAQVGQLGTRETQRREERGMLAFSRAYGQDPSMVGGLTGRLSVLFGRPMGGAPMTEVAALANRMGMGGGRLAAFLEQYGQTAEQMFERTGETGPEMRRRTGFLTRLPGIILGDVEAARGASGARFQQSMIGIGQGMPMQTTLLRAMNYGGRGGPGFIEAMKRLELGLGDQQNLEDFAKYARRAAGPNKEAIFSMLLEPGRAAGMNIAGIEALAGRIAEGKLEGIKVSEFMPGGIGKKELEKMARDAQGAGERFDVANEQRRAKYGPDMLKGILNLGDSADAFLRMIEVFTGEKLGKTFETLTGAVKDFTEAAEGGAKRVKEAAGGIRHPIEATNRNQDFVLDQIKARQEAEAKEAATRARVMGY